MKWTRNDVNLLLVVAGLVGLFVLVFGFAVFTTLSRNDARTEITSWCEFKGGEVVEVCTETACNGKYPRMEFWCVKRIDAQPQ